VALDDGRRAEFITADAAMASGFEAAITGQRPPEQRRARTGPASEFN
jgi:hypothetical protein